MYVNQILRLPDVARRLKLSYPVVYRLVLTGELEAERVGCGWQVKRVVVERFAKSQKKGDKHSNWQPTA